jgi:hypothetical protein
MESDIRRNIYNQVSQHVDIGSYDDFSKAMDDPSRRQKFHTAVSNYVDLGDFDKFDNHIKSDPQIKFWDDFGKNVTGGNIQEMGSNPESLKAWSDYDSKLQDEKTDQTNKQKAEIDKQKSLGRILTLQPQAEQLDQAVDQLKKGGTGNVIGGGLKGVMSFVNLLGVPFSAADAALRKIQPSGQFADIVSWPFEKVGETLHNTPDAISGLMEKTGAAQSLRDLFPNAKIDPNTAKAITEPVKDAVAFAGQALLGKGLEDLSTGIKTKAGIPENLKSMLKESEKANFALSDPTRDVKNEQWNASEPPAKAGPETVPKQKQLNQAPYYVTPEGVVTQGADDLKDLKSEREGLVNELHILRSKLNIAEDPKVQKRLQGYIDDRLDRVKTIDEKISPGKKTAPAVTLDNTTTKPLIDHITKEDIQNLPTEIGDKIKGAADDLQSEIKNASVDRSGSFGRYENVGDGYTTTRTQKGFTVNYFPKWFSDLGRGKEDVIAALQKIKEDAGKDKGKLVEDLKNTIVDRLKGEHEDVLRMNVGGVDHTENLGSIPGDSEITDFINSIDKNLTLQQLHDEYQNFQDAAKFDPKTFENPSAPSDLKNETKEPVSSSGRPEDAKIEEPAEIPAVTDKSRGTGRETTKSGNSGGGTKYDKVPLRVKPKITESSKADESLSVNKETPGYNKDLYKKVLNEYSKGYTLNSADLGDYANEKLPTAELFKRIEDLGLTDQVKDFQKKLNTMDNKDVQSKAEDYERIARITLKEAESGKPTAVKEKAPQSQTSDIANVKTQKGTGKLPSQEKSQMPEGKKEPHEMTREEFVNSSGDTQKQNRSVLQETLDKADSNDDFGIRVIPSKNKVPKIGEVLENSQRWEDGNPTGEPLDGVSTIGINSDNVERALNDLHNPPFNQYRGSKVVLVKGKFTGGGEDAGEAILSSPEVVKIFDKSDLYQDKFSHESAVRGALEEGKKVPQNVLDEYPELKSSFSQSRTPEEGVQNVGPIKETSPISEEPKEVKPTGKNQAEFTDVTPNEVENGKPAAVKEPPKTDKNQGSMDLQSTIIAGLKEFAEEDITPAVQKAVSGIKAMLDEAQKTFAPATRGNFAQQTARILRRNISKMVHKNDILNEHFNDMSKFFKKQDPEINGKRILDAENGIYTGTKAEQIVMKAMQEQLNKTYKYIVETYKDGTGKFIENYFPHYWEDPKKAADVWAKVLSKRSFSGPRSFEKQRSLPTIKAGLDLGLKLATDNPVDLFQLKMSEMNKYIMAMDSWQEFKDAKLLKFNRIGSKMLEGYAKISDRMGTVFGNPNIEIPEYFDQLKREKLEEMVSALGGEHTRDMKLPGGALGYFKSPNTIKTKFATPLSTLTHELGHYIDQQYGLADKFVNDKRTKLELRRLADLRYEGQEDRVTPGYKKYVRQGPEKMANMIDAYVNAPKKFKEVAPTTYQLLKSFIDDHSELNGLNDIEDSLVRTGETKTLNVGGQLIHGHWTMPEQAATIVNNYLSPGLQGNAYYDLFRKSANTLNSVQLGISGFHALFDGAVAMTSKMALGFKQLSQGRLLEGGQSIIEGALPTNVLTNLMQGSELRKAWYGKNPALWQYVKDLENAGGRVQMDRFYNNSAVENWFKAWRTGNYLGGAIRTPGALIESFAKPLMQHFVPLQKLGTFMDMAKNIHAEASVKGWDGDEIQKRMAKAWNSVDYRMGQLTYDNLFWNRTLKDLSMASVRSVGWNLGDIAEIGGGVVDMIKQIKSAVTGKGFELTDKMAFTLALPVVTGLYGAITQYLYTGKGPEEMKDYFYPKTGQKTPDGNDERITLPSYMKDVWAYGTRPATTVTNKLQPLGSAIIDMLKNEDYYGYEINDKNFTESTKKLFEKGNASDLGDALTNEMKYIAKQFLPFSVQGAMQRKKAGADAAGQASAFFGLNPAPKYITNTSAQNEIEDTYRKRFSGGVKAKDQQDVDQAKRDIRQALKDPDKTKAQTLINDAIDKGYFEENSQTIKNMMKASGQSFDKFAFARLPEFDQSDMLDKFSDEDIQKYLPYAGKEVFKKNPELLEKAVAVKDSLNSQIKKLQDSGESEEKIAPLEIELGKLMKAVGKGTGVDLEKPLKGQTVILPRRKYGTDSTGVYVQ